MPGNGRRRGRSRDELVAAATDFAIENGLSALSLRPLASHLGISHRTLLYHFGSKEQLLQAILREARSRERVRALSQPVAGAETPPAAEMLRGTWDYLSGPREHSFWRFYFEVHGIALQDPERYPDTLHEGVWDWLTAIRDILVANGVDEERAVAASTLILAAFRGLMLDMLSTGEVERVRAGADMLVAVAAAVTGGAGAPPG